MEITSYSHHRMNNYDWIQSYCSAMGKEAFDAFLNRVFGRLMKMRIGDIYDLTKKVQEANRDLFIKCVCLFMSEGNSHYLFSEDYTVIKKYDPMEITKVTNQIATKRANKEKE